MTKNDNFAIAVNRAHYCLLESMKYIMEFFILQFFFIVTKFKRTHLKSTQQLNKISTFQKRNVIFFIKKTFYNFFIIAFLIAQ